MRTSIVLRWLFLLPACASAQSGRDRCIPEPFPHPYIETATAEYDFVHKVDDVTGKNPRPQTSFEVGEATEQRISESTQIVLIHRGGRDGMTALNSKGRVQLRASRKITSLTAPCSKTFGNGIPRVVQLEQEE